MEFRPCIDIHNGQVKQIVGSSLNDASDAARENFVSDKDAAYFATLYREKSLTGGHVILLNPQGSPFYEADKKQAVAALQAYPGGLQVGGGITAENAAEWLDAGASHVIVTSYVFQDGQIHYGHLEKLAQEVGRSHLVLDLSCKLNNGRYFIVTDRWQKETQVQVSAETLRELSGYCDEFLIHGADAEGKSSGIEEALVQLLGEWDGIPVTYAGGVRSVNDLALLQKLGQNRVHVTIGSALDLFGGELAMEDVLTWFKRN